MHISITDEDVLKIVNNYIALQKQAYYADKWLDIESLSLVEELPTPSQWNLMNNERDYLPIDAGN